MLDVGGAAAVGAADGPAVGVDLALVDAAGEEPGLDGDDQAGDQAQAAAPARYFADLRLVCSLLNGAWPDSQNLITSPGMAEDLDRYIASISGTAPGGTHSAPPPLDARPGAALITRRRPHPRRQ